MDKWTSHDGRIVIYNADARDFLPTLADESVDAFVTDPPFAIPVGAAFVRNGGATIGDGDEEMNRIDGDDPFWFMPHATRATVEGGHVAVFIGGRNRVECEAAVDATGWHRWMTFYLVNNNPPCTPRPTFASGVQECVIAAKPGVARRWFGGGATPNVYIGIPGTREWDRTGHTAQKPLDCMKRLCHALAPADGLVCDPFLGSGTTAVACVQLGQRFIGCEREREWFENACARVAQHAAQTRLL